MFARDARKLLKINNRFYVVDQGVWFESDAVDGPWIVSTSVPDEVYDIPPSEPVYHVRHVYVYDYTPSVVYVGYTPGYYCSYVYYGTVIYGTGYYYHPWYRVHYYPWPMTFGFAVHYNPFIGFWGFPVGFSYGWISFGWFPYQYAYWGPSGYVYGYRHGYYHGHHHGYYHGYRNGYRHGYSAGRSTGYRGITPRSLHRRPVSANAYKHRVDGVRRIGATTRGTKGAKVHPNLRAMKRNTSRTTKQSAFNKSRQPNIKLGRRTQPGVKRPIRTYKPRAYRPPTRSSSPPNRSFKPPKRAYKSPTRSSSPPTNMVKRPPPTHSKPVAPAYHKKAKQEADRNDREKKKSYPSINQKSGKRPAAPANDTRRQKLNRHPKRTTHFRRPSSHAPPSRRTPPRRSPSPNRRSSTTRKK